ncbi:DUF3105 domain-containing protein [Glaciibacter psychrotolerans]|uniref:DUF3105 domain-containing protein n=1 Tax=Glaciibacter psychrotolerans TaxID=670054 RepID=A0A7Z0EFE7_9MICO|nr:DUF3105 domain-containing protein [Leifsonia psychrotolerans]NYJ20621.1 hypothetical protein [Leifsonia psychrotolerans]
MTPASSSGSKAGAETPTIKQQRQIQRDKKLEEFRRQEKRSKRNRTIGIVSGAVAVVAVVGLVVTSVVLTPQKTTYTAGGTGAKVSGAETFTNGAGHVETAVTYPQTPPAGGEHNPMWLNCGVYTEPVPNENAVHSLEHGAVWVTYDPSISDDDLAALKLKLPSTYVVLSPFADIPAPIVVSAWNAQLQVKTADDPRISEFIEEYWKNESVPEPGSACTGALDAPGKVS